MVQEAHIESPAPPDRRVVLGCFGAFLILMGLFFLLSAISTLLMPVIWNLTESSSADLRLSGNFILPTITYHATLAICCVWLGIGSLLARRWARTLVLVMSVMWLVFGALGVTQVLILRPWAHNEILDRDISSTAVMFAMGFVVGIMVLFMIALPLTYALFYMREDVRLTCERRDPIPRWTDRCPIPVLGLSVYLMLGALGVIWSISFGAPFFFFGTAITGIPSKLLVAGAAVAYATTAWQTYRLNPRAWVAAIGLTVLFGASSLVTFTVLEPDDVFAHLNFSDVEIDALSKTGLFNPLRFSLSMGISSILLLLFLVYLRRYFSATTEGEVAGQ